MPQQTLTARSLKVVATLDPAQLLDLVVPNGKPRQPRCAARSLRCASTDQTTSH
jgi:hypothetical protein